MKSFILFLTSFFIPYTVTQLTGLLVKTQQGDVAGTLVERNVRQFLGIPYAVANRWEAPRLPPRRLSPFQATRFGDSCLQSNSPEYTEFWRLAGIVVPNVTESEDCLSVNIWAPAVNRKQKTAVMIWVHGGLFNIGTSNFPTYDGRFMVRDNDDITVVSFNYRLNIFGQPNAPQLRNSTAAQNFGLLDLDAAVKWVHDNIANFGGDPDRIILFGESAGGIATDAYTFSHPNDTIVKGVIELSGGISGGGPILDFSFNPSGWNNVSNAVGCGTTADANQLACMKRISARTLEEAMVGTRSSFGLAEDNITIFSDTPARAASGNFLKVPLLVGSTQHEADIFVIITEILSIGVAFPLVTEIGADLQTQLLFTCPASATALDRLRAGVPTWRYQYQAVFPSISTRPDLRAWHGSELVIVFGTYNQSTIIPHSSDEYALSRYMQSALVAFARDPQNGLSNFGWPKYDPNANSLIEIGNYYNRTKATFGSPALLDAVCSRRETLLEISAQVFTLLEPPNNVTLRRE